ncbi:hypothetical protein [Chitinophaga sp. RAB17]|uniref:hypothetical protein n=1 Tax=Chitinophaga sp. RAB17 TaxID=3233049 RepID=UPI003F9194EF
MEKEPSSIFDQNFIEGTQARRREIMPLGLKIYVWFYLLTTGYTIPWLYYAYVQYQRAFESGFITDRFSILSCLDLLLPVLLFLANLFLLLEKKWAVLFAIIATMISILSGVYSIVRELLSGMIISAEIWNVFWIFLKIPYLILLLRVKQAWETKALSGRELRAINNNPEK